MSSSANTSEYVPMDSVALRERSLLDHDLNSREESFLVQCERSRFDLACTRVPMFRQENPALADALRTEEFDVRNKVAKHDDIIQQSVNTAINWAAKAIDTHLDTLEETSQDVSLREKKFVTLMMNLKHKAKSAPNGMIEYTVYSPNLFKSALSNEKKTNPTASEKLQRSNAIRASTWQKQLKLKGLKEYLEPDTLNSYYQSQERVVPEIAERLTDELKDQLTEDIPQLTEKTKHLCIKYELPATSSWLRQEDLDRCWQVRYPHSKDFFSALSEKNREKLAEDGTQQLCSDLEASIRDIIKAKERNNTLDVGSLGSLYVELQLNPNGLDIIEPISCCGVTLGVGGTEYKLNQDSIRCQLKAKDDVLHGVDHLTPINLSSIVDITDAQYDLNL